VRFRDQVDCAIRVFVCVRIHWEYVVVDEGHRLKNRAGKLLEVRVRSV
jgi:hypothetical protein